jgi:hypothetical protein
MNASTQREKIEKLIYSNPPLFYLWALGVNLKMKKEGVKVLGFDCGFGDYWVGIWRRGIGGCS